MVEMVVFDMAGTTVNEDNVVYKTLQKAINKSGLSVTLDTVLLHGAGKEKLQAIKDVLLAEAAQDDLDTSAQIIFEDFLKLLKTAYEILDVRSFEDTEAVFDYLKTKGVKVVLNTGYNRKTAESLLQKLNWKQGEQFDLLVTADDVQNGRPKPDMIFLAMKKMGVEDASKVLKVGDSIIDIEEGKSAGCGYTLGITTGAQTEEQLKTANPNYVIDSLSFLKQLV